jgi:hypothetical protein
MEIKPMGVSKDRLKEYNNKTILVLDLNTDATQLPVK